MVIGGIFILVIVSMVDDRLSDTIDEVLDVVFEQYGLVWHFGWKWSNVEPFIIKIIHKIIETLISSTIYYQSNI